MTLREVYLPTSASTNDIFKDNNVPVHPPLYPLIYSAGPDGKYEVQAASGHNYSSVNNNPYYWSPSEKSSKIIIGSWADSDSDGVDGRIDNITSHDIGTR